MAISTNTERHTLTVRVSNIPQTAIAKDLFDFLESALGKGSVFALEIFTEHENWKSRGHGRAQLERPEAKIKALSLSQQRKLTFKGFYLSITHSIDDIINRPVDPRNRVGNGAGLKLISGVMVRSDCMGILESWEGVKVWVMPERRKIDFYVNHEGGSYKLELQFADVLETKGCCLDEDDKKVGAVLLKV